jgi:arylsulfatase A-like enzyme
VRATGHPGATGRVGAAFAALVVCAAVQLAFAAAYAALRGGLTEPGYLLLTSGLTIAAAGVVGSVTGWLPGSVAWGLAVWAGGETLVACGSSSIGIPLALALAATVGFALRLAPATALFAGVRIATALCGGILIVPLAANLAAARLSIDALPSWLVVFLGFEAILWTLAALSRLTRRDLEPALACMGLAAALAAVPWIAPGPDRASFKERDAASPGDDAARPNILVLILDTVRADHLSVYGYERDTTPELARFVDARPRAVVLPHAYAPGSWTVPSHLSLFTGLLPSEHQGHCRNGFHRGSRGIDLRETLAARLGRAGYRTAGVIANSSLMAVEGAGLGFDLWYLVPRPRELGFLGDWLRRRTLPLAYRDQHFLTARSSQVNREVLSLLGACRSGGCFIVANYIDAHAPYSPSIPFAGRFADSDPLAAPYELTASVQGAAVERAMTAYDEEILELDASVGRLLRAIDERDLLDDMWLIVTSDHGEAFQEHRSVAHASSLYEEQVRIPLVVHHPEGAFLPRHEAAVSLLDVAATLSALATGAALGAGRDLRDPQLADEGVQMEFFGCPHPDVDRGAHAELPQRAVVRGDWKLLDRAGERELYLLRKDPGERTNSAVMWPDVVAELDARLPPLEVRSDRVRETERPLDDEAERALRELGYVR